MPVEYVHRQQDCYSVLAIWKPDDKGPQFGTIMKLEDWQVVVDGKPVDPTSSTKKVKCPNCGEMVGLSAIELKRKEE